MMKAVLREVKSVIRKSFDIAVELQCHTDRCLESSLSDMLECNLNKVLQTVSGSTGCLFMAVVLF